MQRAALSMKNLKDVTDVSKSFGAWMTYVHVSVIKSQIQISAWLDTLSTFSMCDCAFAAAGGRFQTL